MSRWFRVYDSLVDDPKVQLLSAENFRGLVNLWCLACRNEGCLPPMEDIAFSLRTTAPKVERLMADLAAAGLIEGEAGVTRPHNWSGRQFKSDVTDPTAPERMRRYRGKRNENRNGARNTDGNDDSNAERNAHRNGLSNGDGPQITETDTDTRSLRSRVAHARKKPAFPLPENWSPNQASRERAGVLGFSETAISAIAEDLRVWAESKGEVRADWDRTFDGFVRRDAKSNGPRGGRGPPNANGRARPDNLAIMRDILREAEEKGDGQQRLTGKQSEGNGGAGENVLRLSNSRRDA